MKRALILLLVVAGCKHHNSGPGFQPDLSGAFDGGVALDDLAGLEAAVCAAQSQQAEQIGVDLVFALDTSYSMDFNLKWSSVSQALIQFLQNPSFAGLGVGIQYFPIRDQCNVSDYATPAVPIDLLPGAAPTLIASIQSKRMSGGTPMVPAMEGILEYAQAHAASAAPRRTVVVLATDGEPDSSCVPPDGGLPNTVDSVVQLVHAAATASPPVLTYVIGVGSELTSLNAIAAAGGGTPSAFLVDTTQDIQSAFLNALDTIRKKALVCEFVIPPAAPGLSIDYSKVNVRFTTPSGASDFVYVGSHDGCGQAPSTGWYYDDPNTPTKVILCDQTCDAVRGVDVGQLNILFGCQTVVP